MLVIRARICEPRCREPALCYARSKATVHMKLFYQTHSPYARKVLVMAHEVGLAHRLDVIHEETSPTVRNDAVFALNPLGKVPVLLLDDGERLYDSRAILDYLDGLVSPDRRMVPADEPRRRGVLRVEAVALGLTEKLLERGFEFVRRDPAKRDGAVVQRVERQISSALAWLEALQPAPWMCGDAIGRADVTAAIAYTYIKEKQPVLLERAAYPALAAHCARCEALLQFRQAAYSATEAQRSGRIAEAKSG